MWLKGNLSTPNFVNKSSKCVFFKYREKGVNSTFSLSQSWISHQLSLKEHSTNLALHYNVVDGEKRIKINTVQPEIVSIFFLLVQTSRLHYLQFNLTTDSSVRDLGVLCE